MEKSKLEPIVRHDLDILFIGLNPGKKSSDNGHYFSANQRLWKQLYNAGLITKKVDKKEADDIIFKNNQFNFHGWSYGVTDLVPEIAESKSGYVKPNKKHKEKLKELIQEFEPKVAILLHYKVGEKFLPYLGEVYKGANFGEIGKIIDNCSTMFYSIGFPHVSKIPDKEKIENYKRVKEYLLSIE